MRVVFLGTPEIAVPSLEYLINKEDVEVLAVVTQPDKRSGRGKRIVPSPVKAMAKKHGLDVLQPKSIRKSEEIQKKLIELAPDFLITFAFGQILSSEVLEIPKFATVNLHASLLPKYRGANPIQAPIINGDKMTGITTMITEIGVDTGPILLQQEIEISENMTAQELWDKISETSPQFIYDSLKKYKNGEIKPQQQDNSQATHAGKVTKEDGLIDWAESAQKIHNKVRGLNPWPSTFTYINDICMKITETRLNQNLNYNENINSTENGQIIDKIEKGIIVATGEGLLVITKVKPACKAEMAATDWFNGARVKIGDKFESIDIEKAEACECACEVPQPEK